MVNELNAVLGLVLVQNPPVERDLLMGIQNDVFDVGADLCVPERSDQNDPPPLRVQPVQVTRLEKAIDRLNERLQPLKSFVLPGGTPASAWCHHARTTRRGAERAVVTLMHSEDRESSGSDLSQPTRRLAFCVGPHF